MMKPEQVRKYFEARLNGQKLSGRAQVITRCPLHEDRTASLSINMEKGVWKCHAGCGQGDLLKFEMTLTSCDRTTAQAHVAELLGERQMFAFDQQPEAVYAYHDANGVVLFEKVRYPGKRFLQRKPTAKGGYEYKLGDCKKPLYHLPEVLTANEIFICEGEKDTDAVRALGLGDREAKVFVTATTNFDGAGKWRDEYAVFFAGKKVVIFCDNDEPGRNHAERVARSVYPFALGVKLVSLPGLPDKGDVSDYLSNHSAADLIAEIKRTPQWQPGPQDERVLVLSRPFVEAVPPDVDWLVDGVIQRGANGFFCAAPKAGKSWAATDLALSLAAGKPWLGFSVPRPVRVALVSREDNPALTAWRLRHLAAGKGGGLDTDNLYINTRAQTPEFLLDNPEQLQELIEAMQRRAIEFAIFDVFNVMHGADENDNSQMRIVLQRLSQIQAAVGCGVGVVHHLNKNEHGNASLTQRLRGASAIAGWCEWLIGIGHVDEDTKTRRVEFELKAACPPERFYFHIVSDMAGARLERTMPINGKQSGDGSERCM